MKLLKYLFCILLLTIVQIFFLRRMWSGLYVSVYIAIVLLMDIKTSKWIVLLTGFFTGGLIDLLSFGAGLNAAVTGLMAFCRYPIIRLTIPNNVIEDGGPIITSSVSFSRFILYVSIMVLFWSVCFFSIESSFINPIRILINILFNTVFGTLAIVILQFPVKS